MDNNERNSHGKSRSRFNTRSLKPGPSPALPGELAGIKRNIFSHLLVRLEKTQISGGMKWSEPIRPGFMHRVKQTAAAELFNQKENQTKIDEHPDQSSPTPANRTKV